MLVVVLRFLSLHREDYWRDSSEKVCYEGQVSCECERRKVYGDSRFGQDRRVRWWWLFQFRTSLFNLVEMWVCACNDSNKFSCTRSTRNYEPSPLAPLQTRFINPTSNHSWKIFLHFSISRYQMLRWSTNMHWPSPIISSFSLDSGRVCVCGLETHQQFPTGWRFEPINEPISPQFSFPILPSSIIHFCADTIFPWQRA